MVHRHWMQTQPGASLTLPGHTQPLTPPNSALGRKPPQAHQLPDAPACVCHNNRFQAVLHPGSTSPSALNQSKQFHRQNILSASTQSLLIEAVMDVTLPKHSAYAFPLLAKTLLKRPGKQLREARAGDPCFADIQSMFRRHPVISSLH